MGLSFRDWAYPTKKSQSHCCAWGECGFLAHAIGNCVTIYSNEIGRFSPMHMWCPFEHQVTAMGWYDGSCTPSVVQPILAIASETGQVAIYDIRNRNILGKVTRKRETINVIKWSPFYRSRFYMGTESGQLICCQMDENYPTKVAIRAKLNMGFPIDFIALDPQTGTTAAIASKSGSFSIIPSIIDVKNSDTFEIYSEGNSTEITTLNFFPSYPNFIIISSKETSNIFAIHEKVTIPFIQTTDIIFISPVLTTTNRIMVGTNNEVSLWEFHNDSWSRIWVTNFTNGKITQTEAIMYASLDDKILIFTASRWLTLVEEHQNKLFITQRIRIMPSKPLDWDFRKGSIAFSMSDGQVLCTSWTPDSIIKPVFGQQSVSIDDLADVGSDQTYGTKTESPSPRVSDSDSPGLNTVQFNKSFLYGRKPQNTTFSQLMGENNELEVDIENDDFEQAFDFSTSFVSIPASHAKRARRRSSHGIRTDIDKVWSQIMSEQKSPLEAEYNEKLKLPTEQRVDSLNSNSPRLQTLCGNSNTLLLCFKVSDNPLHHVIWAPGGRLIVWSFSNNKNSITLVDFKKRETTQLLKLQLTSVNVPITNLYYTDDRSKICIMIDGFTAVFMTTNSNPKQIGSINFKSYTIGSFDPSGTQAVFISVDSVLYFVTIEMNSEKKIHVGRHVKLSKKYGVPSYILWRKCGILLGTDQGYALNVSTNPVSYKEIIHVESSQALPNPIRKIGHCSDSSYFILDSQQNAMIVSNEVTTNLKGKVKNIKLASRDVFLVKFAGMGRLSAVAAVGQYQPLPPPCISRCPLMQDEVRYSRELSHLIMSTDQDAIKACRLFGAIFIQRLIRAKMNPNRLSEHVAWLFGIISGCPEFDAWAIRIALKTGDCITARNLLMMTPPDSPHYIQNMTKASLFDAHSGESIRAVTQAMISNGNIDDAIDILLTVNDIETACKKLIEVDDLRSAAMLVRTRRESERNPELVHTIATQLIEQRSLLLGLLMLSEGGFHDEMIQLVSKIIGPEMSHLLSFLNDDGQ